MTTTDLINLLLPDCVRHRPARGAREPLPRREGPRPPLPGAGPQPPPLSPGPAPTPGVPRHPVTPGHRCSAVLMLYIRVFFSIVPKRIILQLFTFQGSRHSFIEKDLSI